MGNPFSSLITDSNVTQQTHTWGYKPTLAMVVQHATLRQLLHALVLLFLLVVATVQPSFAQDESRQSEESEQIDLLVFAAEQQDDVVQVAWQVGIQSSNWNFAVYRSAGREFADAEPVAAPIFSSASTGSEVIHYSLSDESNSIAVHYWLVALNSENTQQVFGPYDVEQRLALFLPLIFQNR